MPDSSRDPFGIPIAQALRGLPLEKPDSSALPALRDAFRRRRQQRVGWILAAAAALGVVALLPTLSRWHVPDDEGTQALVQPSTDLQPLMDESARIEALLRRLRDPAHASASDVLLDLAFEDRLHRVDAELADDGLEPARRADLWRLRVALLRSSVELESARRLLAAENDVARPAVVGAQ